MAERTEGPPRKRKRDVRSAVLLLLAERPMTGSEMIEELSARSGGEWQASATTIYPMLQMLDDDALVASDQSDDGKRRYRLTDAGRSEVERIDAASRRKPWEQPAGEAATDLIVAIAETARVLAGAAATADDAQRAELIALLEETRRRIGAIAPEAGARSGGRIRPGGGWPINIPDWIFGGAGGGTAGGGSTSGPFGRNLPWWLGGEGEPPPSADWDSEDDGDDEEDDPGDASTAV